MLGITYEMMQLLGLVTGTSETIDVLVCFLGTALEDLIIKKGN